MKLWGWRKRWFWPTLRAHRVRDISIEALLAQGFRGIIIDLDNTLVGYRGLDVDHADATWLADAAKRGLRVLMVTNNSTPWAASIAKALHIGIIANARKPLPKGFKRALDILEMPKDAVVVIGDQLFTDVLGARLFGVRVILVDPIVRRDPLNTRPLRWLEYWLLRGLPPAEAVGIAKPSVHENVGTPPSPEASRESSADDGATARFR